MREETCTLACLVVKLSRNVRVSFIDQSQNRRALMTCGQEQAGIGGKLMTQPPHGQDYFSIPKMMKMTSYDIDRSV